MWKNKRKEDKVHANHFIKGAPVHEATCPSHSESSQQLEMKQLTGRGVPGAVSHIYSPGNDGNETRRKNGGCEQISWNIVSSHLCAPSTPPSKSQSPLQFRQWQAAEQRCSRPLSPGATSIKPHKPVILCVKSSLPNLICNYLYHLFVFCQERGRTPPRLSQPSS